MAVNRVTRIDTSGERWYAKPNDKVRIVTGLSDDEKSQLQRTQLEFNVKTNSLTQNTEELGAVFEIVSDEDKKVMKTSSLQEKVRKNKKSIHDGDESTGSRITITPDDLNVEKAKIIHSPYVKDEGDRKKNKGNAIFVRDDSELKKSTLVEDEYSDIIVEGDRTYLETTRVVNGKKTVSRLEIR
ncbi:hypothetical protein [Butyrivibrio sp. NC3005]|jgi:hypothetical protein|uniref:hypothetical protein n=1 Tax=Butyrivibrio sp. NC3005 TaxID=1280685 RepID=UPI0003F5965A|nr:hypothetical protein [Butyrivibrio sp. NC3005]